MERDARDSVLLPLKLLLYTVAGKSGSAKTCKETVRMTTIMDAPFPRLLSD